MNLTEIFIENNKVDITADLPALLTFTIDDVKDFAARNTSFSKTIVLPGTARNNAVFGNIFAVNNGNFYDATLKNVNYNFNAAKTAQCFIFQGNIQMFKGVIRILEIINDRGRIEYECAVFGELGGFIAKLGNKKLDVLDFSSYDHVFNTTNITNSWSAAKGLGYYYPLIDYGTYGSGTNNKHDWDIRTFRPALYVKEYLDKIFAASGYTYNSALFNSPRFKSLIIPNNRKQLIGTTTNLLSSTLYNTAHVLDSGTMPEVALRMTTLTTALFTPSAFNSRFTYTGTNPVNLNISLSVFTGKYVGSVTGFTLSAKKNGVAILGTVKQIPVAGNTFAQYYGWSFNVPVSFATGDYFELIYTVSNVIVTATDYITAEAVNLSLDSVANVEVPINVGDQIKINDTIPKNYLQKDFLASLMKLFNLYIYEDKDQLNTLYIKPYTDFMDTSLVNAVDWTYKLNRAKPIRIKPMSELNSRFYEFKYKSDSDFYNEAYQKRYNQNYGDNIYDSTYEFAQEKNTVELIFSGTPLVGYSGEDKIMPTIYKKSGTVEENIDSNIRIMQSKLISSTSNYPIASWNILDSATVLASLTSYGYAGHFDDPNAPSNDLGFGVPKELYFKLVAGAINVNQFNVYWSPYMSEIVDKDSRLLTASFRLRYTDIHNLDFSKYVFIDSNLYVLNKINDYNVGSEEECMCSLLKVIDSTAIASAPTNTYDDLFASYTGLGTEGTTLIIPTMQNKFITLLFKGDKALEQVVTTPTVNQFNFNNISGLLTFGNNIELGQVIQILYRTV